MKKANGFTIVELLIVIVVIGIIATITLVSYNGAQNRARTTSLLSSLKQASDQLELIYLNTGSFPANASSLKKGSNIDYEYTAVGKNFFCLTAVMDGSEVSAHVSSSRDVAGTPVEGPCPGHSGKLGRDLGCPSGFIPVPGNSLFHQSPFCVMKYEAKNVGNVATSQMAGTPWINLNRAEAITRSEGACSGCELITESQWMTIAHNIAHQDSNWTGGSVGSGLLIRGHTDNAPAGPLAAGVDSNGYSGTGNSTSDSPEQRRTFNLSNGEVIWDFSGNVWDRTLGQAEGGQPGGSSTSWREWNAVEGTGSLNPSPFPSFGMPASISWNSDDQGIGMVAGSYNEMALRAFLRGGSWNYGKTAGVFTLDMYTAPTHRTNAIGFRVTRE